MTFWGKMKPKVLVYIPCYNYAEFIRECLDSVISQTYSNQEIIIGFNGTTDGGDEIVTKEYPMVKTLHYPFQKVNPGIDMVLKDGDYEVYTQLCADDKMEPMFWEQTLPLFEEDVGVVRVGYYQFSDKVPEGSYWKPSPFNLPEEILEANKIFFSSPIRKAVWESVGGYDPEKEILGDWDFWIKAIMQQGWKWRTLDKPMIWYRRHSKAQSYAFDQGEHYRPMSKRWVDLAKEYGLVNSLLYKWEE